MGLFAAVVSYTLPDVEREPGKLPAWVYQSLPFVGLALVAGCLVEFGATLRGFCAAVFCLALVIVTATDLEYRLIPNRVVGPASLIVLVGMTIAEPSPRWAIAAFGASLFLLVFSLISPQGMGMGDVKLAFLMGAALGPAVAVALVLASLSSLVPSIVILVRHGRAGRKVGFPFGPFLALGSVLDALPLLIALSVVSPTRPASPVRVWPQPGTTANGRRRSSPRPRTTSLNRLELGREALENPAGVERLEPVRLAADQHEVAAARIHRQPRLRRVPAVVPVDQVVDGGEAPARRGRPPARVRTQPRRLRTRRRARAGPRRADVRGPRSRARLPAAEACTESGPPSEAT